MRLEGGGGCMKSFKTYFLLISILSAFALILTGCGEGGGGGTTTTATKTPAQLTSTNTPQAASGVVQIVSIPLPKTFFETASLKEGGKQPLLTAIIDRLISLAKNNIVRSTGSWNLPCTNGGTESINATWTDENLQTEDLKDLAESITFSSCKVNTETTVNGSITIQTVGWLSNPTQMTASSSNMSVYNTHGTSDTNDDDNLQTTNLIMTLTGMTLDQNYKITAATALITGNISGKLYGETINLGTLLGCFDA